MTRLRSAPWLRFGLVAGPVVALAAGLVWLGPPAGQAEAAALSPKAVAGFQTTDKLRINVNLANPDGQPLRGTLRLELRGPDGQPLGTGTTEVRQTDAAAGYHFEFPAPHAPANRLTLRCTLNREHFQPRTFRGSFESSPRRQGP